MLEGAKNLMWGVYETAQDVGNLNLRSSQLVDNLLQRLNTTGVSEAVKNIAQSFEWRAGGETFGCPISASPVLADNLTAFQKELGTEENLLSVEKHTILALAAVVMSTGLLFGAYYLQKQRGGMTERVKGKLKEDKFNAIKDNHKLIHAVDKLDKILVDRIVANSALFAFLIQNPQEKEGNSASFPLVELSELSPDEQQTQLLQWEGNLNKKIEKKNH